MIAELLARLLKLSNHDDMKTIWLTLLFLLLILSVADAQQADLSLGIINDEPIAELKSKATKGDAEAQFTLGRYYNNGIGVGIDNFEAVKYYRASAEQGNGKAQANLGVCYFNGTGVTKNSVEAVNWFRKAAEQGIDAAQNNLGTCYATGEGVLKDYVKADMWFNLASAQGHEAAKQGLSEVERLMSSEQIAEAQKLAREFNPHRNTNAGKDSTSAGPSASGSGFFITDDGYFVSNFHVVKDAARIMVKIKQGFVAAQLVKYDAANDIALLKASMYEFKITKITKDRYGINS